MKRLGTRRHILSTAACFCLLQAHGYSAADVRTDGSLGAVQILNGKMVVPQTLGQAKGQNLFHSFSVLNVNPGESLSFTTTDAFQNIVARVTGGTSSNIQGLLQVQAAAGSKPNFYLINPKGVVVGQGAVIDVPAGLHITTAHYLQFADGQFHADLSKASSLSAATPEAFGFLGGDRATIKFTGRAQLTPVTGREISLVAGDVIVEDTWLKSYGGDIRVMAVADARLAVNTNAVPELKGTVTVTDGGLLDSSGAAGVNGGNIAVSAGDIYIGSPDLISFNGISSNATALSGNAGNITVRATGELRIVSGNSITSSTHGAANGGEVNIHARQIVIDGYNLTSTGIHSNAEEGTGNAGRVNVTVDETLHIENGGAIATSTFAEGKAGIVTVNAKNIVLDGKGIPTGIVSETSSYQSDSGMGGEVYVQASEKISIIEGATISASSYTAGNRYKAASAGQIFVQTNNLDMDGLGDSSTGIRSFTASVGNAGNITVKASGDINIKNGASITTETNFLGAGGNITLSANNLSLDGMGDYNTGIFSNVGTQGSGDAGAIKIQVNHGLRLQNSAKISSSTDSFWKGSAGSVTIDAGTIVVKGSSDPELPRTEIVSAAHANDYDRYSTGNAGAVNVLARESLNLQDGASISSSTYYKGVAGTVNITSPQITLSNGAAVRSEAGEFSSGQTGNLSLTASERLVVDHSEVSIKNAASAAKPENISGTTLQIQANTVLLDHADITAASSGNIAASQIQIDFGRLMRMTPGLITTSAVSGNGGNIRVSGQGALILQQSQISTSVSGLANGNGGDIAVSAPVMVLNTGAIQANTAAAQAFGGDVKIQVSNILSSGNRLRVGGAALMFDPAISQLNVIQAAAADGVSGAITLASPPLDLTASLSNLMPQVIDNRELNADFCRVSNQSSMTILGRGGLPFSVKHLARVQ
ncbi:filamentous hemagglutinin N-terminal domain-containing protein [Undibacterium sp. LX40W]|uniref:Filamentous hemagglutinin N-terminal domain-containing protein n=1 Tax=Undibacterium nitidum TaxID=2762298 RepID=A0A923HSH7_9BURK|nr:MULTISPECIES: filamentous hemagglutinin N-terminal domain-containing protein [Undibacterium]MBC3883281.1 filamentous hemagglutinin N-terminal domain-containing protein [Undibacterium nitidum]MBC3893572.1 filamentous hemagglutinin N-terminal domain-containing protein [Undibacterium sp. LX40W]